MKRAAYLAEVERRIAFELSIRNAKSRLCPNCGEHSQVQLFNAFHHDGVLWKCRTCKHEYHDERTFTQRRTIWRAIREHCSYIDLRDVLWAVFFLLLYLASSQVHAQKLLWRIEIHGTDTVAVGPAGDIDSAFVRWSLRGKALRECKWDLKWKQDEVEGLYRERDKCEELRKQALRDMKAMRANEESLNDRANKFQRQAKGRGWKWFGKAVALVITVKAGSEVYKMATQ